MLYGKGVPGTLNMAPIKQQEQERQYDATPGKEKEQLLPAPETLAPQDKQHGEANVDEHTDDDDPPLRSDTQYGEGCQQIAAQINPAALPGSGSNGGEGNWYSKGEGKPGIKTYPEKDEPHALAPAQ